MALTGSEFIGKAQIDFACKLWEQEHADDEEESDD